MLHHIFFIQVTSGLRQHDLYLSDWVISVRFLAGVNNYIHLKAPLKNVSLYKENKEYKNSELPDNYCAFY